MPEDRAHQSKTRAVPVITFDRGASLAGGEEIATPTSFDVIAHQRRPDGDIWIFIGDDEQAVELTLESARCLQRYLAGLLQNLADR